MGAPSHEKWGQAGRGGGCILIPCLGWKMGGCHGTPTHFHLHTGALERGPPAPYCAPTALQDRIPPPAFPPRSLLFHPDSRFPIAVATSGMATRRLLQGHVSHVPSPFLVRPPQKAGGAGVGGQGGDLGCRVPAWASLFALSHLAAHRIKGSVFCSSLKGERAGLLWRLLASSCPLGLGWASPGPGSCCWGYLGAPGGAVVGNGWEVNVAEPCRAHDRDGGARADSCGDTPVSQR